MLKKKYNSQKARWKNWGELMKTICPECHFKMEREKWWFDGEKLHHACVYCYWRWRTAYMKQRSGHTEENSDDIS